MTNPQQQPPVPGPFGPGQPMPGQPGPGQPGPGQWGPAPHGQTGPQGQFPTQGYPPAPARPSFFAQLPNPIKLALASSVAGVIAFVMGFVSWVTIDQSIERRLENWADVNVDSFGIPAFLTMVFTPGYFLLGLGAGAIAALGFVAVKWRRYLPHVAFLVTICWLGVMASALGLPPFISMGAGAIVALIFSTLQFLMIAGAVVMDGLNDRGGER